MGAGFERTERRRAISTTVSPSEELLGTGRQSERRTLCGGEDYFAILTILKTAIRDHSLRTSAPRRGGGAYSANFASKIPKILQTYYMEAPKASACFGTSLS